MMAVRKALQGGNIVGIGSMGLPELFTGCEVRYKLSTRLHGRLITTTTKNDGDFDLVVALHGTDILRVRNNLPLAARNGDPLSAVTHRLPPYGCDCNITNG